MAARARVVVDTNALVSRLLMPDSAPGRAVPKAVDEAQVLVSEATLEALADVLARPKFDAHVSIGDRQEFIDSSAGSPNGFPSPTACRPAAIRRTTSSWSLPSTDVPMCS